MKYEEMDGVTDDMLLGDDSNSDDALPEGAEDELTEFLESFYTEDVAKGYAVGKNPNSHKKSGSSSKQVGGRKPISRADIEDRYSGDRKVRDVATVKQFMRKARLAQNRGDSKGASAWAHSARLSMRSLRAGYSSSNHMKGLRNPYSGNVIKGYGVGKNPNSHKRTSANRGFKGAKSGDDKVVMQGVLGQARKALAAARKAKDGGDKGKASHMAHEARYFMRMARHGGAVRDRGLDTTPGGRAHVKAVSHENNVKRDMRQARRDKQATKDIPAASKWVAGAVKSARSENKEATYWRNKSRMTKRDGVDVFVPIVKADSKEQIVYGWASPVNELGKEITDLQGDVIDVMEVRTAAHEFMMNKRVGGAMHKTFDAGQVVESMVFDADLQKALGIDMPYEGWFIGVKITKADDWAKVVSGEYTGFSIGGSGVREAMAKSQPGPGDVHSAAVAHSKGCVCADCKNRRLKKAYGPGKNPNSHKKSGMANRSGKPTRGAGVTPIEGQARTALRAARKALNEGDKGKASHYAYEARIATRAARSSYNGDYINSKGLTQTEGSKAHNRSLYAAKDASTRMKSARYSKDVENNPAKTRRIVARAMESRANAKKDRALSRMTKGYAPGKNPNSHKRVGGYKFDPDLKTGGSWGERTRADNTREFSKEVKHHMAYAKKSKAEGRIDDARKAVDRAKQAHRNAKGWATGFNKREELEKARAKSQYGIGKNPNSHKRKTGGADMASEGRRVGGKLLLQREESDAPRPKKTSGGFGWGGTKAKSREKGFDPKGHDSLTEWKDPPKTKKTSSFDGGFGAGRKVKHPAGLQPDQQADEKAYFADKRKQRERDEASNPSTAAQYQRMVRAERKKNGGFIPGYMK